MACNNLHYDFLQSATVTVALSCITYTKKVRYWLKLAIIFILQLSSYPTCICQSHRRQWKYCYIIWCGKTRIVWLPSGEKNSKIWLTRFDTNTRTWQTDRQTDGHHI